MWWIIAVWLAIGASLATFQWLMIKMAGIKYPAASFLSYEALTVIAWPYTAIPVVRGLVRGYREWVAMHREKTAIEVAQEIRSHRPADYEQRLDDGELELEGGAIKCDKCNGFHGAIVDNVGNLVFRCIHVHETSDEASRCSYNEAMRRYVDTDPDVEIIRRTDEGPQESGYHTPKGGH